MDSLKSKHRIMDRLARRGLYFANAIARRPYAIPPVLRRSRGGVRAAPGSTATTSVWHQVLPGVATIPQHFKANGYYVAGGGKVYHHPPGFNRLSDWHEYFNQVFDGHFQARQARGRM